MKNCAKRIKEASANFSLSLFTSYIIIYETENFISMDTVAFSCNTAGFAEDVNGTCRDSLTWTLSNGTLTISGTGKMWNYNFWDTAPWSSNSSSITAVIIADGVTGIGDWVFYNHKSLSSIIIPGSVKSIGDHAFESCESLDSITIPNSVESIGEDAFYGCSSLGSITIPDSVESISDFAFADCISLSSITIPDSVKNIGSHTFAYCEILESITIPNSVGSIGERAFTDCKSLGSVTIGNSVAHIGNHAFYGSTNITLVTNLNPKPQAIDNLTFANPCSAMLYVPAGSIEAYKSAEVWGDFKTITAYTP